MTSPVVKKVLDRLEGERELAILESNNEIKQPKLWARAKELAEERHKVYSPDAHGWAIRWYQQKGGVFELSIDEGKLTSIKATTYGMPHKERKEIIDKEREKIKNTKKEEIELDEVATTRIPAQNGNVYELMYSWRGKTYFCKMFFPNPKKPSTKEVQIALNQVYPSAILRNCVISAVDYGDPYIHAGKGDGFTGKATGY